MKNETLEQTQNIDGALPCAIKPPFVQAGAALPTVPANGINGVKADDIGIASYKPAAGSAPAAAPMAGHFQDLSDSKKNLIKSPDGLFWCYCHLQDLPVEKQSVDKRFCTKCYEVLADEADDMKAVGNRRRPWWVPFSRQPIGQVPVMVLGQVAQTQTVSVTPENCLFCGKELMKRRKSKLFCGGVCRVRYSRQPKAVTA